jgi:hypothetical protein
MLLLKSPHDGIRRCLLGVFCAAILAMGAGAEAGEWKSGLLEKGSIAVKYRISEQVDGDGTSMPLIEYEARATGCLGINAYIALIKDVARHKDLIDAKSSEMIKAISGREWLVYYRFAGMGPIPGTDCVATMRLMEDAAAKSAVFTLSAAPTQYERMDVKRFGVYDLSYRFTDIGNGRVEITTSAKMVPAVKVPLWMVNASCPGAAGNTIRQIIKLAK